MEKIEVSIAFHAGTKKSGNEILSNGGRVIAVSSYGKTMQEALTASYANVEKIKFEKMNYRKDIGKDLAPYFKS